MAGADATIRLTADATGVKAAINDAKTALQQLKDAAKGAGEELNAGTTKYLTSLDKQAMALERQAATFGKSKAEAAEYLTSLLGVSGAAAGVVERIDAAEKALTGQAIAAKDAAEETTRLAAAQAMPVNFVSSLAEQAAALEKQSLLFGKTRTEIAAFEAAELGASAAAAPFIERIAAGERALEKQALAARDAATATAALATAQAAPGEHLKGLDAQAAALERLSAIFGKTKAQIAAYDAAQAGVGTDAAAMVTRIDAAEKSLEEQALAAKKAATATAELKAAQAIPGDYLVALEKQAAALERQVILFGKDKAELAAFEAAELGVASGATAMVERIRAANTMLDAQTAAARKTATAAAELKAAQAAPGEYLKALEQQTKALEFEAATYGKTKSQIAAYKAEQLGVAAGATTMVDRLKAAEASLNAQSKAANDATVATKHLADSQRGTTISAGQLNNALRQTPAQFTDIFVSLASGQQPLTVLLQQGGQLKDMFGSVGGAAKAIGGYVLGLINPFTIAAAAAAALGYALYKAEQQSQAFKTALILTGNYAGVTAGQLSDMAKAASATVGTQGDAAAALTQLAASGKVAGSSFESITRSAILFEKATGQAVEETVKQFISLGEEPVKASLKLNETYHHLNTTTYERITALVRQGNHEEAAALAQDTLQKALKSRAEEAGKDLGYWASRWKELGKAADDAINLMSRVVKPDSRADEVAKAREALDKLTRNPARPALSRDVEAAQAVLAAAVERERMDRKSAGMQREQAVRDKEGTEAAKRLQAQEEQFSSKRTKMAKELREYEQDIAKLRLANPTSDLLDPAKIAETRAGIAKKYKEDAPKAFRDDAATKALEKLKETGETLRAQADTQGKLLETEKELVRWETLFASFAGKKLTDQQKSYAANKADILEQAKANVERERSNKYNLDLRENMDKLAAQDRKQEQDSLAFIVAQNAAIASSNAGRKEQYDSRLSVIGMGSQAAEQAKSKLGIIKDFAKQQDLLDADARKNLRTTSDAYKEQTARIKEELDRQLQHNADYYDELKAKQSDWTNGAKQALQNYYDKTLDISKQTEDAVTNAFKGMENAMVDFVTKGKADFKGLITSILADMLRMQVQKQITGPLSQFFNALMSGAGGGLSTAGYAASGFAQGTGDVNYGNEGRAYTPMAAGGLIPFDGFRASLHKGERVVPAGDSAMKVTINNNGNGEVSTNQIGPNELEVIISAAVGRVDRNIGSGTGSTAQAMKSRGLNLSGALPRRA